MNRSVLDLKIGEVGIVKDFREDSIACKLLTIGIIPDVRITVIRKSPLGRALCLKFGQTHVAVRNDEAEAISLY